MMPRPKILLYIGLTEILIGSLTLLGTAISLLFSFNTKTPNVLTFILISATISLMLGFGILILSGIAYKTLIYFSSFILINKVLILFDIFRLNGALETFIPPPLKNMISIVYHAFVIVYLCRSDIKKLFIERKKI